MVAILSGGCFDFIPFDCESYVPQKWHLGQMEAELKTFKPTLTIADTIHLSFKLPKSFKDTLDQEVNVDRGVQVFVKITTTSNRSATLDSNFFAIDTTIFNVFDQYFETKNLVGSSIDAYTFKCELNNEFWEIETEYIIKKAGNYWASIEFRKIDSSETDSEDGVCMLGDPESFGASLVWKENENNRIDILFNDKKEKYPEYYGFIVGK